MALSYTKVNQCNFKCLNAMDESAKSHEQLLLEYARQDDHHSQIYLSSVKSQSIGYSDQLTNSFGLPAMHILKSISFVLCFRCHQAFAPTLYLPTKNHKDQSKPPTWKIHYPPDNLCDCQNAPYRNLTYIPPGGGLQNNVGKLSLSRDDIENFLENNSFEYSNVAQSYLHAYSFPFLYAWCRMNKFRVLFWKQCTKSSQLAYLTRGVTREMKNGKSVLRFLSWTLAQMPSSKNMQEFFSLTKQISADYFQRLMHYRNKPQSRSLTLNALLIHQESVVQISNLSVVLFKSDNNECKVECVESPSSTSEIFTNEESTRKRSIPVSNSKYFEMDDLIASKPCHSKKPLLRPSSSNSVECEPTNESSRNPKRPRLDDANCSRAQETTHPLCVEQPNVLPLLTEDVTANVDSVGCERILDILASTSLIDAMQKSEYQITYWKNLNDQLVNYHSKLFTLPESRYNDSAGVAKLLKFLWQAHESTTAVRLGLKTLSSSLKGIEYFKASYLKSIKDEYELAKKRLTLVNALESHTESAMPVDGEEVNQAIYSLISALSTEI